MLDREIVLPGESIAARIHHEDDNTDVARLLGTDSSLEEVFPFRGGEFGWRGRERVVEADLAVLEPKERVAGWSSVVDPRSRPGLAAVGATHWTP